MRQLMRRRPTEVMGHWLKIFSRWSYDPEIWPLWRALGIDLVSADQEALRALLHRISVVYSVSEQVCLSEVLLWAKPSHRFELLQDEVWSPTEQGLLDGLSLKHFQKLTVVLTNTSDTKNMYAQLGKASALALWRTGVFIADDSSTGYQDSWLILLNLASAALYKAASMINEQAINTLINKIHPLVPSIMDNLYIALNEKSNVWFEKTFWPAKNTLAEQLQILSKTLPNATRDDNIERLAHWLNVILINTPNMDCPNPFWPPLECSPAQFPALGKVLDSIRQVEPYTSPELRKQCQTTQKAYDEWVSACSDNMLPLLAVYGWMVQRAAELAAEEGDRCFESWFRELKGTNENRSLSVTLHSRSRLRWAFRRTWDDPPWWLLYKDPRKMDPIMDEEEMLWLVESALEYRDPEKVCPVLRRWLGEVLSEASLCGTGFLGEPEVGLAFERL
jgi:hypothetical protein